MSKSWPVNDSPDRRGHEEEESMSNDRPVLAVLIRSIVAVVAVVALVAFAACGSDDGDGDSGSSGSSGDESQFPDSTFGDLSGMVTVYDVSGGAHTKARASTVFKNFTDLTGVPVRAQYNTDLTKFFATMESGRQPPWNLIEITSISDFNRAKELDYLEKLDPEVVPLDNVEAAAADPYGIYAMNYSANLVWNTDKWPEDGEHPETWEDLYDTEKFPGKRCMYQYPEYGAVLESALLADGVEPADLYPLDVDRAFAKLDTIKDEIVWYLSGADATRFLTTGECDLGIIWNGRVASGVADEDLPLALSWDQAITLSGVWGIPKGAPDVEAAQALIAFWILDIEGQIDYVTKFAFTTDIKGISDDDYPESVRPYIVAGDNLETTIKEDTEYYEENLADLSEQFNEWVGQ